MTNELIEALSIRNSVAAYQVEQHLVREETKRTTSQAYQCSVAENNAIKK